MSVLFIYLHERKLFSEKIKIKKKNTDKNVPFFLNLPCPKKTLFARLQV